MHTHKSPVPLPHAPQVPDYEDRLSRFERMCVVKAFREDRTLVAAADYIADALGTRFVESVPLSMEVRGPCGACLGGVCVVAMVCMGGVNWALRIWSLHVALFGLGSTGRADQCK